jgi:hypothetical protein
VDADAAAGVAAAVELLGAPRDGKLLGLDTSTWGRGVDALQGQAGGKTREGGVWSTCAQLNEKMPVRNRNSSATGSNPQLRIYHALQM